MVTANTFIPENEAFAVKKAQMDRSIDNLSITPNRKQEFKEVLNSFAETTRGHDIIAGAFSNTRFCTTLFSPIFFLSSTTIVSPP
ncbi:MAG: hypothetical protein IKL32_01535 [Alphaproteobacteria bacterium]|nr:hypothetical protein [Alphaproteobacteria bacterium]